MDITHRQILNERVKGQFANLDASHVQEASLLKEIPAFSVVIIPARHLLVAPRLPRKQHKDELPMAKKRHAS